MNPFKNQAHPMADDPWDVPRKAVYDWEAPLTEVAPWDLPPQSLVITNWWLTRKQWLKALFVVEAVVLTALLVVAVIQPRFHSEAWEDGSAITAIEWLAPGCERADEPCYLAAITDAETGEVRFVSGP